MPFPLSALKFTPIDSFCNLKMSEQPSSTANRGLASIPPMTSDQLRQFDNQTAMSKPFTKIIDLPENAVQYTVRHAKPDLWSIKQREAKARARSDLDQAMISRLTRKRRLPLIQKDRIIVRQGPAPDLLSVGYSPVSKLDRQDSKYLLPPPSFMNEDAQEITKKETSPHDPTKLPPIINHSKPRKGLYSNPILRQKAPINHFKQPPKLPHLAQFTPIRNEEVDLMLIQKPVVIYWKRIKG